MIPVLHLLDIKFPGNHIHFSETISMKTLELGSDLKTDKRFATDSVAEGGVL